MFPTSHHSLASFPGSSDINPSFLSCTRAAYACTGNVGLPCPFASIAIGTATLIALYSRRFPGTTACWVWRFVSGLSGAVARSALRHAVYEPVMLSLLAIQENMRNIQVTTTWLSGWYSGYRPNDFSFWRLLDDAQSAHRFRAAHPVFICCISWLLSLTLPNISQAYWWRVVGIWNGRWESC